MRHRVRRAGGGGPWSAREPERFGRGFLASVRSVAFHADRLDDVREDLDIEVEQIAGGAGGMLYRFRGRRRRPALVDGALAIVLER
jgi:predicted hotdog family 3-hydroxylacyl-ACP dehydratase